MAYISTVNDLSYTINAGGNVWGTFENSPERDILLDGRPLRIDWRHLAPLAADSTEHSSIGGRYSLIIASKSYDILARRLIKPDEKEGHTYEIQLAGYRFEVYVEDEREKALASSVQSGRETGEAMVRAPMPGLVLGIPYKVGTAVERGQTVAILEAMKMENDLSAPIAGTIKEIRVSKGQTVNQGDVLVVIASG